MVFKRVFFYVPDWSWTAKHLPGHTLHMKTLESTHINHLSTKTLKSIKTGEKPKFTILIKQEKIKSKLAHVSIHIKKILESDPVPKSAEIRNISTKIDNFLYEFRPKIDNFLIKIICKLVWTGPANYQTWPRRF